MKQESIQVDTLCSIYTFLSPAPPTRELRPTDRLTNRSSVHVLCVRDIPKTIEHLAFILQIYIPHDIISTRLDHGGDWLNYVAMATVSVT